MNVVQGTSADEVLTGLPDDTNEIHGAQGDDTIIGGKLDDRLFGDDHDDYLWGDSGNDSLSGGAGFDTLYGSEGSDVLSGGAGNDTLSGGKDNDVLMGDNGSDRLYGNSGNDSLDGGLGNDLLVGGTGDDFLDGGAGNDYIDGGSGNDTLVVGLGYDTYIGGSGYDTLDFFNINSNVSIDLSKNTMAFASGLETFTSTIDGFEMVVGNDYGATMMGDKGDTWFMGGMGDDWFRGKGGADTFTGGAGQDTFVWLKKDVTDGQGVDHITDFEAGNDILDLSDFVKGGQDYADVIRLVDTEAGTLVEGKAKGQWVDVVVLDGRHGLEFEDLFGGTAPGAILSPNSASVDDMFSL